MIPHAFSKENHLFNLLKIIYDSTLDSFFFFSISFQILQTFVMTPNTEVMRVFEGA